MKWYYIVFFEIRSDRYNSIFSNFIDVGATVKDMDGLKRYSMELKSVSINPEDARYHYLFKFNFDNIKLYDLDYNDHSVFQKTRYSTISLTFYNRFRRMLYNFTTQLSVEKAVDVLDSETDYTKAEIDFSYKRYLTKKSTIKFKIFGSGLWGSDIPTQELIYASGDTDPKHKQFALGRRGTEAPLRIWTFNSKMNMPGYSDKQNPYRAGKAGASIRLEYERDPFPTIYGAAGSIGGEMDDFGDNYFAEYGLIVGGDILSLVFPLYVTDPSPDDKHLAFRFQFNFKSPINISY